MKTALTQQPATTGQIRQLKTMAKAAVEKVFEGLELTKEEALAVQGDSLISQNVRDAIRHAVNRKTGQSHVLYPPGYEKKIVDWQVHVLQFFFPQLVFTDRSHIMYKDVGWGAYNLPKGAEHLFAIPKWEKIAPTYCEAVREVFRLLKQIRSSAFTNRLDEWERVRPLAKHLRESPKKKACFTQIREQQKTNDILVIPAQFGLRYANITDAEALKKMSKTEFALGAFEVAIMILTDPTRMHDDGLDVTCAGDEYNTYESDRNVCEYGSRYACSPFFCKCGFLDFGAHWRFKENHGAGTASGFLVS